MKLPAQSAASRFGLILPIALAAFVWITGCATHKPDPLAGWERDYDVQLDKAIIDDYNKYIQSLPIKEGRRVDEYSITRYKEGMGDHAVKIRIFLNGTILEHDLFYDQNNRRTKAVRYVAGKYGE